MAWVPEDDFQRILEMGKEIERRKARGAQNRVLRKQDRADFWFTFLCCTASVIIIVLGSLRLLRELAWWLT